MTLPLALAALLVGLALGSVLGAVARALPRSAGDLRDAFRCGACRGPGPMLGTLLSRGRCRRCGEPIPWLRPLAEGATALFFLGAFWRFGVSGTTLLALLFGSLLILLALIDVEHMVLPDSVTLPGVALGLVAQPLFGWVGFKSALLGALLGAAVLLAFNEMGLALRGRAGIGLGDVKMAAMIGAFLGLVGIGATLVVATLAAGAAAVVLLAGGGLGLQDRLPFGLFLAAGGLASLFLAPGAERLLGLS